MKSFILFATTMKLLGMVLLVCLAAGLLFWIWWSRPRSRKIEAIQAATPLKPTNVTLPEEDEATGRTARKRTGETQELRHKTVHGVYRPIKDRGAPSEVPRPTSHEYLPEHGPTAPAEIK
jgi:hypothetical protein